ncbi:MAG: hydrogenase expression/formation protein HypE [Candidatus Thermoplasmatota archaeon]|nr:hydrogenase expression/formation protein HypE [Candidatus Thermoplasmatota archaeon]
MVEKIKLAQGAGGQLMDELIKQRILKHFKYTSPEIEISLNDLDDAGVVNNIVFSTDSHTIQPLFFPGGNIGSLAVCGTINDVAVMGAKPIALSVGFILEEGFPVDKFDKIIESMGKTSQTAKVPIITGDTKVVEKGAIQEFMINTSGIGVRTKLLDYNISEVKKYRKFSKNWLLDSNLKDGDKLIVSGNIGEHGVALLSFREGFGFDTKIKSDVAPINNLMEKTLSKGGVVSAKDPTRGGLANTLNEFSEKSKIGIIVQEESIPIPTGVKSACDLLGIDPMEIGNEGKVVLGVVSEKAEELLKVIKKHPLGKNAEIIGEATKNVEGVVLETEIGGKRILHKPLGDPIPRIC